MSRQTRTVVRWLGAIALVGLVAGLADAWSGFGKRAAGQRRARMEKSPQWQDGAFENPQPLRNEVWGSLGAMFHASPYASGAEENIPVERHAPKRWEAPAPARLRVTWFGHSSTLVELDGHAVLTDPVWSDRVSPVQWAGPKRWYPPLVRLEDLPPLDAVLISHDHYDHLDEGTIVALNALKTRFVVPLGVGAHLEYWGVPADRIVELDWWEKTALGDLQVVCTPARHASGRSAIDKDATLWAGYAVIGPQHRVFYSGDTGLFPAMKEIGDRFGPFDVTMIEVGQYHRAWPDWHIGPEQAVRAHQMLKGRVFLPLHWGLFTLAPHGWTEPIERAVAEAVARKERFIAPRPGESVDADAPAPFAQWWPERAWETAAQHPIVSTQVD
jgi:L-ascorbate metabolism protein UlaG (beta-lactamase superfamily)